MSNIIANLITTSLITSIPIIVILLFKDKILNNYTYKLNYIICVLITFRMLFITKIKVYLPIVGLINKNNTTNLNDILSKYKSSFINEYTNNIEINSSIDYLKIIFFIWIIGMFYIIFKNIINQIKFNEKIKKLSIKINDKNSLNILKEERKSLGLKRDIELLKIDGLSSPHLINILNCKIALPNKDYTDNELKWIFRHELIHYKRKDNLLKLILMIACSIHWFNPLHKILKVYFNEQCELSCDEKVLSKSSINEAKEYALVLISTLRYKNELKTVMLSSQFNANKVNLIKRRVDCMMNTKNRKKGRIIALLLCSISIFSVISFNTKDDNKLVYANEYDRKEENNQLENTSQNDIKDEELRKNLENINEEEMVEYMEFYQDRKAEDLTQEEIDYALSFLLNGKCKKVYVGYDSVHSINFEAINN